MPWVKIDDSFYDNVTNRALGPAGRDLFLAGLAFCAKGLTDGRIPKDDLPLVLAQAQAKPATVRKLVDAGRWLDSGDHYEVAAYLTYQPSRSQVLADREAARERQRRARQKSRRDTDRDSHETDAVTHGPPDPTRPSGVLSTTAAADTPATRQHRIDEAARSLANERASTRDDVGPGWIAAAARGIAKDHHQALHRHLVDHPEATTHELIDLIEAAGMPAVYPGSRPHEPVNTSAHLRPLHEVLADRPERDPELNAAGIATLRNLHRTPDDAA